MSKALIAMSGGVDSSLAAKMTIDAGYECIGCTMKLYDNEDAGITPNPCIDCNRYMKFDKLFDRAKELGAIMW